MTHKEMMQEIYGCDPEPTTTVYIHATVVIKDGRGGVCRFDKSEVNDLVAELGSLVQNDAPPVKVIDLSGNSAV